MAAVRAELEELSCADCNETDAAVLEFDHVAGEKRATVGRLAWDGCSLRTLYAEIAKCETRCANCHRRRTAGERGSFRARAAR